MKLIINPLLQSKLPNFNVIAYTMDIQNGKSKIVEELFNQTIISKQDIYTLEEILHEPRILEARNSFKQLGKDPSHTRVACENLWRRMIKHQEFYHINDIVDLGNILSIITRRSVCVVDSSSLKGDVEITLGTINDIYETINRGLLNVDKIPVYRDEESLFGCPCSDTLRTIVKDETKSIFIMIICFSKEEMNENEQCLLDLFTKYASAKNIKKIR